MRMRWRLLRQAAPGALAGCLVAGAASAAGLPATAGDAVRGRQLYLACQACHAIDDNDIGPRNRGVVGRRAGSLSDYNYSVALRTSGITWDEATLDRWLANPSALVPGTKMYYLVDDGQARADLIAYLKAQR